MARMTIRTISAGLLLLGLPCGAAQPAADASDAGWNDCLKAPTRACVLRQAAAVALTINDPYSAADDLSRIAEAQFKAGLTGEATATIDQSVQVAKAIADDGHLHDDAIKAIATVQAKAGKLTDALAAVGSIKNRYVQARVIGAVAVAEGKAGRLDDALRRVQAIEDLPHRALVMRQVVWDLRDGAVASGEDDKIVAALFDVQAIEQRYPPPTALSGIHHPSEFIPALAIIAQAQVRAGKTADAMRTAGSVTDPMERTETFATIAVELNRAGATASALKVARAVDDRPKRGMVLDRILEPRMASELVAAEMTVSVPSVKAEPPNASRDAVTAFTDREQRATALGIVAMALANADHLTEAIELAELIDQGEPSVFAWHAIAVDQAKTGLSTPSIASFDRAVQAALSFQPHDRLLSTIAISQAEAGQITEALRVTGLIGGTMATAGSVAEVMINGKFVNTDHDRRRALHAIAKAQAKVGSTTDALRTASALMLGPETIGSGLGAAAEGLAEAGRIPETIEAAANEDNLYRRSSLLASIAKARATAGRIEEAKQLTQHIALGPDRIDALVAIAAAQMKATLMTDALASLAEAMPIAQSLPYKSQTTRALIAIAAGLPD
jgi:tetratricopeptide (TPR) repeat protein